jgi:hypothetical protein
MGCNCNQSTNYNICNPAPCQEPQSCDCPTILETKCSTYEGDDLECSGIKKGTILTELIQQLDAFICKVKEDLLNAFSLKNIGTGAKVYKGDDLLGRKELRTVTKTGNLVTVTENTNDIAVSIDEVALNNFIKDNQRTYSAANVGTGAAVYKNTTTLGNNNQFNFKKIKSTGATVTITEDVDEINLEVDIPEQVPTYVEAGENVTVTGTGTTLDPYIINAESITPTEISLEDGLSTSVEGDGSELNPYKVNLDNLQKEITTSYTLQASDHLHTIFLAPTIEMIITIPETGLPDNFVVGFYHVSSPGEYAIFFEVENALTQELRVPSGFIATMNTNGNFSCMIERRLATQEYMLNGDLVAL